MWHPPHVDAKKSQNKKKNKTKQVFDNEFCFLLLVNLDFSSFVTVYCRWFTTYGGLLSVYSTFGLLQNGLCILQIWFLSQTPANADGIVKWLLKKLIPTGTASQKSRCEYRQIFSPVLTFFLRHVRFYRHQTETNIQKEAKGHFQKLSQFSFSTFWHSNSTKVPDLIRVSQVTIRARSKKLVSKGTTQNGQTLCPNQTSE